jgi:hypothetical protein
MKRYPKIFTRAPSVKLHRATGIPSMKLAHAAGSALPLAGSCLPVQLCLHKNRKPASRAAVLGRHRQASSNCLADNRRTSRWANLLSIFSSNGVVSNPKDSKFFFFFLMGKSLFQGFYKNFIYEWHKIEIVTFQKIRTKDIGLPILHSSEGGGKDWTDYWSKLGFET